MEHTVPFVQGKTSTGSMTRLTPPNYGVANSFEASYGGSEANIALALANLRVDKLMT